MGRIVALAAALTLAATIASGQDRPQTPSARPAPAITPESSGTPAPANTPGSETTGEQLFASTCGFCHQDGGRAAGRGPKLAGTDRPDAYLLNRIRMGKEGAMPAYGRALSDAQLRSLLAYIRSLKDDGR